KVTRARLKTTKTVPLMPATPKPGNTNTSSPSKIKPRTKSKMAKSQNWLSGKCAQKNKIKQTAATTPGNPTPGSFNSNIKHVMPSMMRMNPIQGSFKKSDRRSNQSGPGLCTCAEVMPYSL